MPDQSQREPMSIDEHGVRPPPAFVIDDAPARNGVTLLIFRGELDYAASATMRARVDRLPGTGMVIDLRDVTFIDSSALRELLNARQTVLRRGGRLVLSGVPASVHRLLEMTGTIELFELAPTRASALASFD